MTEIIKSYEGANIRIAGTPENPLFCAADVCAVLEIANSRDALERLDADEKGVAITDTLGGKQTLSYVTESGLYHLTFKSRKAAAKRFRKWVTAEVLPAIRRDGFYLPTTESVPETSEYFKIINELVRIGCSPDAACNSVRLHIYQKAPAPTPKAPELSEIARIVGFISDEGGTWNDCIKKIQSCCRLPYVKAMHAMRQASVHGLIACPAKDGIWKKANN